TMGIITKAVFIVASSNLLIAAIGRTDLTRPALVAVLTGTLAVARFYAAQRMGIFRWSAMLAIVVDHCFRRNLDRTAGPGVAIGLRQSRDFGKCYASY